MAGNNRCCQCTTRNCAGCACVQNQRPCTNCRASRCENRTQESEEEETPPIDGTPGIATQRNDGNGRDNAVGQHQPEVQPREEPIRRFWQSSSIEEAKEIIQGLYRKVIGFSPNNLFEIPTCNASKDLIKEITHLMNEYTSGTHIEEIALTTIATLPHLLCQGTHKKSKTTDDIKALKRRLEI